MTTNAEAWMRAAAACAFAVVLAAFAVETLRFRGAVLGWAHRDLAAEAALAGHTLAEPLATQDFRRIRALSAELEQKGLSLEIRTAQGGILFTAARPSGDMIVEHVPCGGDTVSVRTSLARVLQPYRRSLRGLALAVVVGAVGMLLVFLSGYRQRVRLREMARLEKFRRTFVADVSHEIKTPLTGILGAVDLLPAATPLAALIRREATRLNALVQQILDLARLEREGEILSRVPTDVPALLSEVVESLRPVAEKANVDLRLVAAPGGKTPPVSVDPQRLSEAVSNLILNALRHSGSPEVEVSCAVDRRTCRILVEDHGVGLPPEHAARVFERFYRVDAARTAETGGAGLGLAIVRRIARLHGGDVTLKPAVPHGCRFELHCPVESDIRRASRTSPCE